MTARPVWMQIAINRGCDLCVHAHRGEAGVLLCQCPAAVADRAQPVDLVRGPSGHCGPDAEHLVMASWT